MAKHNIWISVSDLMTGLMILFMFIAIAYIRKVQKSTSVLSDYVETKDRLHEKLVKEFEGDTVRWDMSIGKDLSMKFKNPSTLFESGSAELTPTFKEILNEFIPRYFNILINDELKDDIMEIRIEGHTDDVPYPQLDKDPYIANVILSQKRALSVLVYIRNLTSFSEYSQEEKETLEYWITANGLSYGKSLDNQGQYAYITNESIDKAKSRRVEFRIVTKGEEMLENFVKKNGK
ncbi:MAG: OmpA family protein [Lachnospiraceae bacterium]|nr:OmpA family protein [Lachnospiraceae bacterium]